MTTETTMTEALATLLEAIKEDYYRWTSANGNKTLNDINHRMIAEFNESISYTVGKKYIKVIGASGGVWGFIVNTDNDKKFSKGTMLKAASWNTPARNFSRGNVLAGGYTVHWTGAS